MNESLHPIQSNVLVSLLFTPEARFSDLNTTNISTDHFNFHIQRLLELDLINKNSNGKYELTLKGKEYANRYDDEHFVLEKQPKVTVSVIGVRQDNNKTYYLMQKRLKHPFFGYMGVVSGKVRFGETVTETAARELMEEAGLKGNIELVGIEHKMDYDKSNQILDDKIFFVFRASELTGTLINQFKGGENLWVEKSEIASLENLFDDILQIIELTDSPKLKFLENKFIVNKF